MTLIMYFVMITRNYCHIQHKPNIFLLSLEVASFPHLHFETSQLSVPTLTLYRRVITHLAEQCSSSHHEEVRLPESMSTTLLLDTRWHSWLRHCLTSRKAADSIPDGGIVLILPVALWPWGRF